MTTEISEDDNQNIRKKTRNDEGNLIPADDMVMDDGPISGLSMERPIPVKLDHLLMHELTSCKRKRLSKALRLIVIMIA
jgi:hypothetical protein